MELKIYDASAFDMGNFQHSENIRANWANFRLAKTKHPSPQRGNKFRN